MQRNATGALSLCAMLVLTILSFPDGQSLTDKLEEEQGFYTNFGKDPYTKLKIEKDVIGLYDGFGEHITDGVHLYDLLNESEVLSSEREDISDSTLVSRSKEFQKRDFFEKFSNLVITQDAIGGNKLTFMVGDQITTRFTPLTFNMTNYRGIRMDFWSTGLQGSFLLNRTRPGFVSKREVSGSSIVEYPISEESFDGGYYSKGIQGTSDFSSRSPYGDIDWLLALHAQNTIANKVDIGLSYINHHVTDVRNGGNILRSDIPDGWMPSEVHFEFFDMTPLDENDAGVYVHNVEMYVNGKLVGPRPASTKKLRRVFVGSQDSILLPKSLPVDRPLNGNLPIIVAFNVDPENWYFEQGQVQKLNSINEIKELKFKYTVAGNYLVFASTSRQIPLAISGEQDEQTDEVEYETVEKPVGDIFDNALKIYKKNSNPDLEDDFSTTYFGEYIRKAPKRLALSSVEFRNAMDKRNTNRTVFADLSTARNRYNFNTYEYTYGMNVSSITYGLNFSGELGGLNFAGELAINQKEDKLPGKSGGRKKITRWVGDLNADYSLTGKSSLDGAVYFISPDWETNLSTFQASRYFKETEYKTDGDLKDYMVYPKPLGNDWSHIEDNDDADPFVESDRRRYPSDKHSKNDRGQFTHDGTMKFGNTKTLKLPNSMLITYDDPDGVIASKDDRNRDGTPDYQEDFLLFSSDPPVFQLGDDLNNNGVPDYEDDDILPDFGHSVGYFITADGIKTQGIKGASINYNWKASSLWDVNFGFIAETILDYDLNGIWDAVEDALDESRNFWEGKSFVAYGSAEMRVLRRSQGIEYYLGNELRLIGDAIRNDAVRSTGESVDGEFDVSYFFNADQLNFRRAVVDNLVGKLTYINIRNFEYEIKGKFGLDKRLSIPGELFYTEYSFYDEVTNQTLFDSKWEPYYSRLIGDLFFINRLSYRIGFNYDFEDWRKPFNIMNRLTINPQYKFGLSLSKEIQGPTKFDPRNLGENFRMDISGPDKVPDDKIDSLYDNYLNNLENYSDARIAAREYRQNNISSFLNVPILRATFKLAENTEFQYGLQAKQAFDAITPEESRLVWTNLAQIVSKASYKGYNVTLFLGARTLNSDYNVNVYDPVLGTGSRYDRKRWEIFARIFSGT
ncbi:MAG: hypothetical protein GF398_11695 [Chitinivibrionales bacterium]|nr:hypothetical protein [Chitinivibrionales bacterium]